MSPATKEFSRRDFFKGTALAALGLSAGGFLTGCTNSAASSVEKWDKETDVLIAGGGLGGLSAAVAAVNEGAKVVLLEASGETGGTALFSGASIHIYSSKTFDELKKIVPLIDPYLGKILADEFLPSTMMLANTGAFKVDEIGNANLGTSISDKRLTFNTINNYITNKGGEIVTGTKALGLYLDDEGRVVGMRGRQKDGTTLKIKAKAVVIASGSFQDNPEMKVRYSGPYADNTGCRAVPYNKGEGIIMATAAGALMSKGLATFYGHLQPFPNIMPTTEEAYEKFDKDQLKILMGNIQNYSVKGICVNKAGVRFIDESVGDDQINIAVCDQPEGHIFVIVDQPITQLAGSYTPTILEAIESLKNQGAVVEEGNTVEELAAKINARAGYNSANIIKTVEDYNQAVDNGTAHLLSPARAKNATKLIQGPFYAVWATAGHSGSYGGLKTDERGRVLGLGDFIIPGLYAAPMAAGGIYYKNYGGALGLCTVFGRRAGADAAKSALALKP